MKTLLVLPLIALGLAGCATHAPQYASRNPYDWQTVSVTPVPYGTASRQGAQASYSNEPVYSSPQPVYAAPQPVYGYPPAPVYAPAPVYTYPPVTIGLDFMFTNRRGWWGHGRRR